ncbi:MAG: hypothetical protein ACI92N_002119, partial [Pseudomonadales bacterium]
MSEAMDGRRQAHTDVLVAVPGQGLPDRAHSETIRLKRRKLPKPKPHSYPE